MDSIIVKGNHLIQQTDAVNNHVKTKKDAAIVLALVRKKGNAKLTLIVNQDLSVE